jgi:hypothetical protein
MPVRTVRGSAGMPADPYVTVITADSGYGNTLSVEAWEGGSNIVDVTIRGPKGGIRGRMLLSKDDLGALAREIVATGMHLGNRREGDNEHEASFGDKQGN